MHYWEEMQSKWGFSDGDAVPAGASIYRQVYIQAVNRLAEQLNSEVRAVAYDRMGVHNYCLILFHRVEDLKDIPVAQYTEHVDIAAPVVQPDEAMQDAIGYAHDADLDNWVLVTVEIDPDLNDFMEQLKPIDADTPLILTVAGESQHFYQGGQIQILDDTWLQQHKVADAQTMLTIHQILHYDANLYVSDADGGYHIVAAHKARVTHIPQVYHEDHVDQSPVPPYRVELVEAGSDDTSAVEASVAAQYFSYDDAKCIVHDCYRRIGGTWEIRNGYGNTCLFVSDENPPADDESNDNCKEQD